MLIFNRPEIYLQINFWISWKFNVCLFNIFMFHTYIYIKYIYCLQKIKTPKSTYMCTHRDVSPGKSWHIHPQTIAYKKLAYFLTDLRTTSSLKIMNFFQLKPIWNAKELVCFTNSLDNTRGSHNFADVTKFSINLMRDASTLLRQWERKKF